VTPPAGHDLTRLPLPPAAELSDVLLATPLFLPSPLIGEKEPLLPPWVTKLTDIAMCCCCPWFRGLLNRWAASQVLWAQAWLLLCHACVLRPSCCCAMHVGSGLAAAVPCMWAQAWLLLCHACVLRPGCCCAMHVGSGLAAAAPCMAQAAQLRPSLTGSACCWFCTYVIHRE
jgi:hypothetical protein